MSMTPDEPTLKAQPVVATPPLFGRMSDEIERRSVDVTTVAVYENPRKVYSPEGIEQLATSILANGLLQVPLGRINAKGDPEVVFGTRRLRAFRYLMERYPDRAEFRRMPLSIRDIPEDAIPALQFAENHDREDLNAVETALHVLRLKSSLSWSDAEIATKLGWSNKRTVAMYLVIAESPAWLQMYATPQQHEVPKLDGKGAIARGEDGRRLTRSQEGAALGMSQLHELARFFRDLDKWDKAQRKSNNEHKPLAEVTTKKLARQASLDDWSRTTTKARLEQELAKITGEKPAGAEGDVAKPPQLTVGPQRLNIDVSRLDGPLPVSRLHEMKEDIVAVLQKLGYRDILFSIPEA